MVQALAWWVLAVSRAPGLTLALLAAGTVAAAVYTATHISVNSDLSDMIADDVPYKLTFDRFNELFPHHDNVLLVVVDGAGPEYAQTAAADLSRAIAADRAAVDHVYWPAGDVFFRRNGLLYLTAAELGDIADRLATAQPLLAELAADPSLRGLAGLVDRGLDAVARGDIAAEGIDRLLEQVTKTAEARIAGQPAAMSWRELMASGERPNRARELLLVKPIQDFTALEPVEATLQRIRAAIAALPPAIAEHVTVRLTGEAMLTYEEIGSATKGIGLAAALALMLLASILIWGLRSPWLATVAFLTIVVGLIWTAFFATAVFAQLNLISIAFAVLFVGLAEDFVIHFGLRIREGIDSGNDNLRALGDAAAGAGSALLFLAVATAIGFLAFVPTQYVGLAELGIIASAGMVIALVATLTVMPALLALRPLPRRPRRNMPTAVAAESALKRRAGTVVVAALAVAAAAATLLPSLRFDADTFHLKDPGSESVRTLLDLVAAGDVALYPVEFVMPDAAAARDLAARLEREPAVASPYSIDSFIPAEQEEKLAIIGDIAIFMEPILQAPTAMQRPSSDETRDRLRATIAKIGEMERAGQLGESAVPATAFATALQRLTALPDEELRQADGDIFRFFPLFLEQLERALSAEPVAIESLPALLRRQWIAPDGSHRVEAVAAGDKGRGTVDVAAFVDRMNAIDPAATGPAVANVGAGRAVTLAMKMATIYALLAIAVLLLVVLRNLVDVALTMLPLVMSGLMAAATAVAVGIPMNFANIITLPLILGIGLAGCSHLLLRAREEGVQARLWETSTPFATMIAAASTVASFGSLALSAHRGTQSMGILLAIAVFWSLAATLLVLPALLELQRRQAGQHWPTVVN
jgi:hypothetical protein